MARAFFEERQEAPPPFQILVVQSHHHPRNPSQSALIETDFQIGKSHGDAIAHHMEEVCCHFQRMPESMTAHLVKLFQLAWKCRIAYGQSVQSNRNAHLLCSFVNGIVFLVPIKRIYAGGWQVDTYH